ncbi:TPA: hypothetical protein ACH3X1_002691 [Trebouxia sp. C0004]
MRIGKADLSGQNTVESVLYLAETLWQSSPFMLQRYGLDWWAIQLHGVRAIVGTTLFRDFEQQLQLSMKQPLHRYLAAHHGMPAAAIPAPVAKLPGRELAVEVQVGLSSGLRSVQEAVDEWSPAFTDFLHPPCCVNRQFSVASASARRSLTT